LADEQFDGRVDGCHLRGPLILRLARAAHVEVGYSIGRPYVGVAYPSAFSLQCMLSLVLVLCPPSCVLCPVGFPSGSH
jgi:hypothetical protein